MLSPGPIQFRMIIQRAARVGMEKSQEDAGQLKNLRFRLVSRTSFSLALSIVRLPQLDVICSAAGAAVQILPRPPSRDEH